MGDEIYLDLILRVRILEFDDQRGLGVWGSGFKMFFGKIGIVPK